MPPTAVDELDLDLDLTTATEQQLRAQRAALLARLGNPGPDDDTAVLAERAQSVAAAVTAYNARVASAAEARAALLGGDVAHTSPIVPSQGGDTPAERLTIGQTVARSDTLRSYQGGRSQTIIVPGEVRALFATANYPSAVSRVPGIVQPDRDTPLTFLDLIDRQPMDSQVVEWVQETGYPDDAAEVTEGSAKPETTAAFALVTSTAATIAHWINITRQTLSDESQMRGYIEGRMTYGLLRRLNAQIVNGNGTPPNIRGILNTSGIGTYTAATTTEAAVISVRKAKTVAQLSEYAPDAVGMNPVDWEACELSTDTTGAWRVVANAQSAQPMLWGLNVIVTTNLTGTTFGTTGGTFLVGAFREGATLWERNGVEFYLTDAHASNFISNILTLLAELRAVLSVWRPKAFVKGTFGVSRA